MEVKATAHTTQKMANNNMVMDNRSWGPRKLGRYITA